MKFYNKTVKLSSTQTAQKQSFCDVSCSWVENSEFAARVHTYNAPLQCVAAEMAYECHETKLWEDGTPRQVSYLDEKWDSECGLADNRPRMFPISLTTFRKCNMNSIMNLICDRWVTSRLRASNWNHPILLILCINLFSWIFIDNKKYSELTWNLMIFILLFFWRLGRLIWRRLIFYDLKRHSSLLIFIWWIGSWQIFRSCSKSLWCFVDLNSSMC